MANNVFSVGSLNVLSSITNPGADHSTALDNFQPFSFFEFLKNVKQFNTPEQFTQQYSEYLRVWYSVKNVAESTASDEIRTRYVDLLKSIATNYTTSEEKRFLANINYDDASDLSIAIPFYAQKLKEICLFYAKKRDTFRFRIEELKIKGSLTSIEKAVYSSIIDYAAVSDEKNLLSVSTALEQLQVGIMEYVDVYGDYFDIEPDLPADDAAIDALRKKYVDINNNDIQASLFLNLQDAIAEEVFNTPIYLKEIGTSLLVNPSIIVKQALEQTTGEQILAQLLGTTVADLSETFALRKALIEKYIGTDFYYISTNSLNDYVSGALFKASNPSGNLSNRRFATTASVAENQLISLQKLGLFFKPDKQGTLQFISPGSQFFVDSTNLQPNKLYVFPDPNVYGNVSNLAQSRLEYPLRFVADDRVYSKDVDQGAARGKIKSNEYFQNFYAYYSEPVYVNQSNVNTQPYDANMLRLFNRGTFDCYLQDAYGNSYGLIKDIKKYNRIQANVSSTNLAKCLTIDGYKFYDDEEGSNFDYATTDSDFNGSIRTGLTSLTVENFPPAGGTFSTGYTSSSANMFTLSSSFYTLYFREYSAFIDCNDATTYTCAIYDGAYFAASDTETLPDVSTDSPLWNENSRVYYSTLCDAGISASDILVPGSLLATMTAVVTAPTLLSDVYESIDCRYFTNGACIVQGEYDYSGYILNYINDVNPLCTSALQTAYLSGTETINDKKLLPGVVYVKNIANNYVLPLSSALSATFTKYNDLVRDEIYNRGVQHINVYYDTIAVRTDNYMVFDKISVSTNGSFGKPNTTNNYIALQNDAYTCTSNTFFREKENDVWLFKTTLLQSQSASNEKTIYPQIYRYTLDDNRLVLKYPGYGDDENSISSLFSSALSAINIVKISDATLTYAQHNDKFNASWIAEDLNGLSYLFTAWFNYGSDDVGFSANQIALYKTDIHNTTFNFYYNLSTFTNVSVASTGYAAIANNNNILYFN